MNGASEQDQAEIEGHDLEVDNYRKNKSVLKPDGVQLIERKQPNSSFGRRQQTL